MTEPLRASFVSWFESVQSTVAGKVWIWECGTVFTSGRVKMQRGNCWNPSGFLLFPVSFRLGSGTEVIADMMNGLSVSMSS